MSPFRTRVRCSWAFVSRCPPPLPLVTICGTLAEARKLQQRAVLTPVLTHVTCLVAGLSGEVRDTVFADRKPDPVSPLIEWKTLTPVAVQAIRLFAAGDMPVAPLSPAGILVNSAEGEIERQLGLRSCSFYTFPADPSVHVCGCGLFAVGGCKHYGNDRAGVPGRSLFNTGWRGL